MSKNNGNGRWLAGTLLAIALTACGTIQGATPAGAGIPSTGASSDNHLTEFDASDSPSYVGWCDSSCHGAISLDQQNEQQRLAQQGASPARSNGLGGDSAGSTTSAPALVP
jgi:hypothetical protein